MGPVFETLVTPGVPLTPEGEIALCGRQQPPRQFPVQLLEVQSELLGTVDPDVR